MTTINRYISRSAVAACAALSLFSGLAVAQMPAHDVFVVTYIEVNPDSTFQATLLLEKQRAASRKDAGNVVYEALERIGRPNQFVLLEKWSDAAARNAHAANQHTREFLAALDPLRITPYDERPQTPLSASNDNGFNYAAVYAITHVDIIPTQKEVGVQLVENFAKASRTDEGNMIFDVLSQDSRPNHMTVVEAWSSDQTQQLHAVSERAQQFRTALLPLSGSLYDERLYRSIQ